MMSPCRVRAWTMTLCVRRVRLSLRRDEVVHRPSLAVGVDGGGGALADADLDVSRAVHQLRLTVGHPADPNGTAGRRGGDAAVGAVDVEVAAGAAEIEVGRGVTDPDLPARVRELDGALDLADPHRERRTVDVGGSGDVADRDLAGRDVGLQRVDAIELDLSRCHVQLALAERAVGVHLRVRQVRDQAGAGGQVDRDGDRAVSCPGGGRLDRQLTAGEVDLGPVGHLDVRLARPVDGLDQHLGVGPVACGDPHPSTGDGNGGGDGPWRGEGRHVFFSLS